MQYAGVLTLVPTPEQVLGLESTLSSMDIHPPQYQTYPGMQNWPVPTWPRMTPVKVNTLYWPLGASRWACAYLLASTAQLTLIRQKVYGEYSSAPLVITDGTRTVTVNMYLLTPRPLTGGMPGDNQMWLLPLVDERYFWWTLDTGNLIIPLGQSWESLVDQVAGFLGQDITQDEIAPAYDGGTPALDCSYQPLPPLLDAIAYAVGQRVIVDLAGAVSMVDSDTSSDLIATQLAQVRSVGGGGVFQLAQGSVSDLPTVLPESIQVLFSLGVPGPDRFAVKTPLASIDLTGLQYQAQPFQRTLYSPVVYVPTGTEANPLEVQDIGAQMAQDYYDWSILGHDLDFDGVQTWDADGVSDLEWEESTEGSHTRVKVAYPTFRTDLYPIGGPLIGCSLAFSYLTGNSNIFPSPFPFESSSPLSLDAPGLYFEWIPGSVYGDSEMSASPTYDTAGFWQPSQFNYLIIPATGYYEVKGILSTWEFTTGNPKYLSCALQVYDPGHPLPNGDPILFESWIDQKGFPSAPLKNSLSPATNITGNINIFLNAGTKISLVGWLWLYPSASDSGLPFPGPPTYTDSVCAGLLQVTLIGGLPQVLLPPPSTGTTTLQVGVTPITGATPGDTLTVGSGNLLAQAVAPPAMMIVGSSPVSGGTTGYFLQVGVGGLLAQQAPGLTGSF